MAAMDKLARSQRETGLLCVILPSDFMFLLLCEVWRAGMHSAGSPPLVVAGNERMKGHAPENKAGFGDETGYSELDARALDL